MIMDADTLLCTTCTIPIHGVADRSLLPVDRKAPPGLVGQTTLSFER